MINHKSLLQRCSVIVIVFLRSQVHEYDPSFNTVSSFILINLSYKAIFLTSFLTPNGWEEALRILIDTVMSNHIYTWDKTIRKQSKGGAIGSNLTGELGVFIMLVSTSAYIDRVKEATWLGYFSCSHLWRWCWTWAAPKFSLRACSSLASPLITGTMCTVWWPRDTTRAVDAGPWLVLRLWRQSSP